MRRRPAKRGETQPREEQRHFSDAMMVLLLIDES
jgi:hypothetical protein